MDNRKLPAQADDPVEIAARNMVILCVKARVEDFDNRCGNGESVLVYREGKRRQPQGF